MLRIRRPIGVLTDTRRHARWRFWMVVAAVVGAALWLAPGALAADGIYWGNFEDATGTISYAALDGSGGADLNTSGATSSLPFGLAIDAASGKIYWVNAGSSTISFANLDGSGAGGELTITGAPVVVPEGLAIDPAAGRLYWANVGNNTIAYANLDGSDGGTLNTSGAPVDGPAGVTVDPTTGRIYWTNGGGSIAFANLDNSGEGGQINTAGATVQGPLGLAIDAANGKIYWANNFGSKISYANLDGSGGGDLNTAGATVAAPIGVAIDPVSGRVYWANPSFGAHAISYANVDGSGGADLNVAGATTNAPVMPVLLETPSGTGAPGISGGSTPGSGLSCSQGSWAGDLLESFLYRVPRSFAYQWSLNGTAIAGATGATYTATAPGQYTCTVTATNTAGSAHQTSALHTIAAPPPASHSLTVTKAGTGQGTVTSSPSGIDCGTSCSASYTAGTTVTLTTSAATGSKFTGWSGACTATSACNVTLNSDQTVTATFKLLAPNTKITHATINAGKHTASFKFTAIGKASGFQCALVKLTKHPKQPTYRACHSPKTYRHLTAGRYKFLVRAHNTAGTDATPASRTFTIRTPHPPRFTG